MSTFTPQYRLTVYAPRSVDATEATVLTPAAGAPHTNPFRVATIAHTSATGTFQPYLMSVQGRKHAINPLTKSRDVGRSRFTLADVRTTAGGSNLSRWWTAFTGDATGRNALAGCKVFAQELTSGDVTVDANWKPLFTGRIRTDSMSNKQTIEIEALDMAADLKFEIFVDAPHSSVDSYAFLPYLLPIGLPKSWGALEPEAQTMRIRGTVRDGIVDGNGRRLSVVNSDAHARHHQRYLTKALQGAVLNRGCRLTLKRLDTNAEGDFVPYDLVQDKANDRIRVEGVLIRELPTTHARHLAFPPANTPVEYLIRPLAYTISAETPLLINDSHPIQLMADVLDGKFGTLKSDGAVSLSIARGKVAGWTVGDNWKPMIDDPTFPGVRAIVKEPMSMEKFLDEYICKPLHITYRIDGNGAVIPIDLRQANARTTVATLTDADLVAEEGAESWERNADESVSKLIFWVYEDTFNPLSEAGKYSKFAAHFLGETRLTGDTSTLPIESVRVLGGGVADLSGRELDVGPKTHFVDAICFRFSPGEQIYGQDRFQFLESQVFRLADELKGPIGLAAQRVSLKCRRTANTDLVLAGSFVTLTIDALPNPGTNLRGGSRVALCTQRAEVGGEVDLDFIDFGPSDPAAVPTYNSVALNAANPKHALDLSITRNAALDSVEIWVATTLTSVGTIPAEKDAAWRIVALRTADGAFTQAQLASGMRHWTRIRSVTQSATKPNPPSAWVNAIASVDTTAMTAPSAMAASSITRNDAIVSWTNGETDASTNVYVNEGAAPGEWTDAYRVATLPAGSNRAALAGLTASTSHTAAVRHRDIFGGLSAAATVTVLTTATTPTCPSPRGISVVATGT